MVVEVGPTDQRWSDMETIWNLWAQRCFDMISSLSTLEKHGETPHFSDFVGVFAEASGVEAWIWVLFVEFHLDPMFPVTARCKKNQCPPWQRHQDGTRNAGTVLQENFQEIVVAGLPKILLDNHRGTRLARSGVDIHQVQMVQTRRIQNFHIARRQTRRPEGHNQRMCSFLIDQNLGSMWTKIASNKGRVGLSLHLFPWQWWENLRVETYAASPEPRMYQTTSRTWMSRRWDDDFYFSSPKKKPWRMTAMLCTSTYLVS